MCYAEFLQYHQLSSENHNHDCQLEELVDKAVVGNHKESPMVPMVPGS